MKYLKIRRHQENEAHEVSNHRNGVLKVDVRGISVHQFDTKFTKCILIENEMPKVNIHKNVHFRI